jgi:hypothetical protein
MFQRIMGVFKLDKATFAEIEGDQSATSQAAIVVVLVAVVAGIGAAVAAVMLNRTMPGLMEGLGDSLGEGFDMSMVPQMSPVGAFLNAVIGALLSWLVWSALTYFVGTKLFGATADMGEMLRVIGFAQAPPAPIGSQLHPLPRRYSQPRRSRLGAGRLVCGYSRRVGPRYRQDADNDYHRLHRRDRRQLPDRSGDGPYFCHRLLGLG